MTTPYKNMIDTQYNDQLRMLQDRINGQVQHFPSAPQHPLSAPINIGTHDPKLKHVNETK